MILFFIVKLFVWTNRQREWQCITIIMVMIASIGIYGFRPFTILIADYHDNKRKNRVALVHNNIDALLTKQFILVY